jgi:hypothetical protein
MEGPKEHGEAEVLPLDLGDSTSSPVSGGAGDADAVSGFSLMVTEFRPALVRIDKGEIS